MRSARQKLSCHHVVGALLALLLTACSDSSDAPPVSAPQPEWRPVVFVHGQSASAQQFETQAMRFTSNGYPANLLFAFEYDTSTADNPVAQLDAFLSEVLATTGENQVYAIGHSRGTSVWTAYLEDPAFDGAARVAKYVNIDGRAPEQVPGGVPTIGIWGEWNTADSGYNRRDNNDNAQIGPDPAANYYFADKSHTEVATSAEAFELMYEFFTGVAPTTLDVTEVGAGTVTVAGRAVFFPENIGYEGVPLEVWEIDKASGQRLGDSPVAAAVIPASGNFGPFSLEAGTYYEFALLRTATQALPVDSVHRFYAEPFYHDNQFMRLQSIRPGESIEAFIPRLDASAGLLLMRQKEFWGDQGAGADELFIDGLDVLTPLISPRALGQGSGANLVVFTFDANGDNMTDLEGGELFPFNALTFLTGADVFIPAAAGGSGYTEIVLIHRGGRESRLNVPNWPSSTNRVSVMFRDDL